MMEVSLIELDGVGVFEIRGEINISSSPELRKIFERSPHKRMLVDLKDVTYVDSSGLATLVEMLKKTKSSGGALGLSGMSDKVRSLFEITKLEKLFKIYADRSQALSALNSC